MSEYTIRPYTLADNAGLACLWNESDDQWPGTFTGGVPMTEEMVRDWMEKETCLMRLVVEEGSSGRIVGYGSLWQDASQSDTCYVELLNVHLAYNRAVLPPHGSRAMVTYLALCESLEEAKRYGSLAEIVELEGARE